MSEQKHKKWAILVNGWGEESRVKAELAHKYISAMDELVDKAISQLEGPHLTAEQLELNRQRILWEED